MSQTEKNLREAFAGESQANRKYLAFAEKADKEGHPQTARLFRAAAAAETVHAHNHLRVLGGVGSTADNLKEAISGETHEFKSMYPEMITQAEAEGDQKAVRTFKYANEVEKIHAKLYEEILGKLGKEQEDYPYYVCPTCGHTVGKKPPEKCPVCQTLGKYYKEID